MAKSIIYYDETGKILLRQSGNYTTPTGQVSTLEVEIPEGYIPVSIGSDGQVVTEQVPLTAEQQRITALEQQMNALIGAESEE